MLLGDLIKQLQTEDHASIVLERIGDLSLFARMQDMAAQHEEAPGEYACGAASRFANRASDEDWLSLMNIIERTDDPATACLRHMIEWSLKDDAKPEEPPHTCSCGGSTGGCAHDGV